MFFEYWLPFEYCKGDISKCCCSGRCYRWAFNGRLQIWQDWSFWGGLRSYGQIRHTLIWARERFGEIQDLTAEPELPCVVPCLHYLEILCFNSFLIGHNDVVVEFYLTALLFSSFHHCYLRIIKKINNSLDIGVGRVATFSLCGWQLSQIILAMLFIVNLLKIA